MTEAPHADFRRHRFPAESIAHAVWLYYRFRLSLRDVEDLLAERGINISFQTVSEWAAKFGPKFPYQLRHRSRGQFADKWQLDEVVVTIKGKSTGYGEPTLRTVTSSMPCCKAEGTRQELCV